MAAKLETMLTLHELGRQSVAPLLPPIYTQFRRVLLNEVRRSGSVPEILDVGGRKSPYTIGVPAKITIIDLPRETDVQNDLNLGINKEIIQRVKSKRSNISNIIFGDITNSDLESESFDMVISVEVLEHVEDDDKFVSEVCRILRPGGRFLMTTPNGDFVENKNPDHKRHYKKEQLGNLLDRHFDNVEIEYAIAGGYYRKLGLKSWSVKRPIQTIASAFGNVVNSVQSSNGKMRDRAIGAHHLFAVAEKTS
jgi:SAM-dependent methyltransferase